MRLKKEGDRALFQLTQAYDGVELNDLSVATHVWSQDESMETESAWSCIEALIDRIRNYQRAIFPESITIQETEGIICQRIPRAIQRVGLYVPGGTAPLISTLLMLAVPAQMAGCITRVLCTPPTSEGRIHPLLLRAAAYCGIKHVHPLGGAQAIAAMAFGTESVSKVDKIFGPGNAWVTIAKQCVSIDPHGAAIDMPAGPSELLIIADKTAHPEFIAADLLSQAEHDTTSQVFLLTPDKKIVDAVMDCLKKQFYSLERQQIIQGALSHSAVIVTHDILEAIAISNHYAPEHVMLQMRDSEHYVSKIQQAGAVFLGSWTAETFGDYSNGANHVLPTGGYAHSWSGLSVMDFMKCMSVQTVLPSGVTSSGSIAMKMADIEGLKAHKNAVSVRLNYLRAHHGLY